jgi:hypothetical protein
MNKKEITNVKKLFGRLLLFLLPIAVLVLILESNLSKVSNDFLIKKK